MKKTSIITFIALGSIIILLTGCVAQQAKKILPSGMEPRTFLKPNKFFEACVETEETGVTLMYAFESTKPVNFNIHYHTKQDQALYLKKVNNTTGERGEIQSEEPSVYCMMLMNNHSEVVGFDGDFEEK